MRAPHSGLVLLLASALVPGALLVCACDQDHSASNPERQTFMGEQKAVPPPSAAPAPPAPAAPAAPPPATASAAPSAVPAAAASAGKGPAAAPKPAASGAH